MTFLSSTRHWMQHGREKCLLPRKAPFPSTESSLKSTTKASNRSLDQILPALMAFVISIVLLLWSVKDIASKRLSDKNQSEEQSSRICQDCFPRGVTRPPSPSPGFAESDLFSLVLQRLSQLEEKVQTLEEKPSEMPCEKEESLNAAVRRMDALETELIVTKKALHEALIRQEELLAHVDLKTTAKAEKKKKTLSGY